MELFDRVLDALEGQRTEVVTWQSHNGPVTEEVTTYEPETWVAGALKRGRVTPVQCLALVLFAVREDFNPESERHIVASWASELRKAASNREIEPRDTVSLLPLGSLPDGWDWLLSLADADKFVASRGMAWTCTERAQWMHGQFVAVDEAASAEPAPAAQQATEPAQASDDAWKEQARDAARAIVKREAAHDRYPPQSRIADEVAAALRARGIFGADGKPLTGATIKRHALRGISSAAKQSQSTTIKRGK